jgi:phage repressor protein C with HTH and peptisase S24 domain
MIGDSFHIGELAHDMFPINRISIAGPCYAYGMEEQLDTPGARLRWARIKAGFEHATDFAAKLKVNAVTYSAHENGTNGFLSKHGAAYAKALGISVDWLHNGGPLPNDEGEAIRTKQNVDEIASNLGVVMVREVDISYAMGDGSIVAEYPDIGMMPFQDHFLRMLRVRDPNSVFVCRGDGDSMNPTIHSQDMVLIDASRNRVTLSDHIWAISVAGAGMIKRLRPLPDGRVMILSDNPSVPEQVFDGEDVYVVGKVIWIGRMM